MNADSSFAARAELAAKHGIVKHRTEYAGTAAESQKLLAALRKETAKRTAESSE